MTNHELLTSFTRIREAAEAHMDELDELGHGWAEESVRTWQSTAATRK